MKIKHNLTFSVLLLAGFSQLATGDITDVIDKTFDFDNKGQYVGSDMRGKIGDDSVRLSMENVNGHIKLGSL